ncbi:MAG: hypothetical protein ABIO70_25065 [Pseudomonadota bacterium]
MSALSQMGIPQELQDRAKLMWIISAIFGLWGWVFGAFIGKVEGQDENEWFQWQLKQNLFSGLISWVGSGACGIGYVVGLYLGVMGFLAIGKGEDYCAAMIGNAARPK